MTGENLEFIDMNNKIYYQDLKNYREGDFEINADLEVFFAKEHIGHIVVVINDHPEGDDELSCFLPGFVGFQHYPVSNASIACQTIYEKYYSQNNQTK